MTSRETPTPVDEEIRRQLTLSTRTALQARPNPPAIIDALNQLARQQQAAAGGRVYEPTAPTAPTAPVAGVSLSDPRFYGLGVSGPSIPLPSPSSPFIYSGLQGPRPPEVALGPSDPRAAATLQAERFAFISPAEAMLQSAMRRIETEGINNDVNLALADINRELQDLLYARQSAIDSGLAELASRYDEDIAELQARIGNYTQAIAESNAAFARRNAAVAPFFQQAISTGVDPSAIGITMESGLAQVRETFAEGAEGLSDFLSTIGANDPDLALELEGDVLAFRDMIEDDLRQDLTSEFRLTAQAGELAQSLAGLAFADDRFQTEAARQKLEIDFQRQINAVRDQVKDLEKQKRRSLADARARLEAEAFPFDDPEKGWAAVYGNYSERQGWNFQQSADVLSEFNRLYNDRDAPVRTRAEAEELLRAQAIDGNMALLTNFLGYTQADIELLDPGDPLFLYLSQKAATPRASYLFEKDVLNLDEKGLQALHEFTTNNLVVKEDYRDVLDLFDLREAFVRDFPTWAADKQAEFQTATSFADTAVRVGGTKPHLQETRQVASIVGRLTTSQDMVRIPGFYKGGTGQIHRIAAPDYMRMLDAFNQEAQNPNSPIHGESLQFTDTYRSYDRQGRIYQEWIANGRKGAQKASPDSSQHPRGLAIDFASLNSPRDPVFQWLKQNAAQYGWVHGFTKDGSEPWHWEYRGL